MDFSVLLERVTDSLAPVKAILEGIADKAATAIPALAPYKEALWWMIPATAVILILFLLVISAALKAPKAPVQAPPEEKKRADDKPAVKKEAKAEPAPSRKVAAEPTRSLLPRKPVSSKA